MHFLHRLQPNTSYPLHSAAATRNFEQWAAAQLAPHTLMQRAGLAVARLACALAPHAQSIWIACGPGNNGGDGLEAAVHLKNWGHNPVVTLHCDETRLPADATASLARARLAGVVFAAEPPARCDLAIDALLGIGTARPLTSPIRDWLLHMHHSAAVVLCVDVPSGLNADTGCYADTTFAADLIASRAVSGWTSGLFCLNLLTLKPGMFTAQGKDAAGQVWLDDLGLEPVQELVQHPVGANADSHMTASTAPTAWLLGADRALSASHQQARPHASHKGSYGDVAVIGGARGMTGAALLAARAALHCGAGRVLVALLDGGSMSVDPTQPELMFRTPDDLALRSSTVVCGCGGGDAVRSLLPKVLSQSPRLVLDADALNAIANDTALQTLAIARAGRSFATVLTPHPLEAARLLGYTAADVQAHRLQAAQQLAERFECTVVLKGAGSIIAAPGQVPCINSTGNAKLATAGTGDVLAGMVGAIMAPGTTAFEAACTAVYAHGLAADHWPANQALTASRLASSICRH